MFGGIVALAYMTKAKFADPAQGSHLINPAAGKDASDADPVIAQVAHDRLQQLHAGLLPTSP